MLGVNVSMKAKKGKFTGALSQDVLYSSQHTNRSEIIYLPYKSRDASVGAWF